MYIQYGQHNIKQQKQNSMREDFTRQMIIRLYWINSKEKLVCFSRKAKSKLTSPCLNKLNKKLKANRKWIGKWMDIEKQADF